MSTSGFKRVGTADSILSAHINGLGQAINKLEDVLDMDVGTKENYQLTAVADQEDVALQYRIYESDIRNWLEIPAPIIYRDGAVVPSEEYILYPGYGAIVFHVQQDPESVITASFSHIINISKRLDDIEEQIVGQSLTIPYFPIYAPGVYRSAALLGDGANYRGADNTGVSQAAFELIVFPLIIPETMVMDRIGTNVITPGGGFLRFGIWKDNGGYPGELVRSAQIAVGTGLRLIVEDYTLEAGLYWIGFHSDGTQKCQGFKSTALPTIGINWNPAKNYVAWGGSVIWGESLPNPFPSNATMRAAEDYPAFAGVFVRRKA